MQFDFISGCNGASVYLMQVLRKAKIVYNSGLSECNRVNKNSKGNEYTFRGSNSTIFIFASIIISTLKRICSLQKQILKGLHHPRKKKRTEMVEKIQMYPLISN